MAIPMLKIRRPVGRLIFNMGIAIPSKTVFLIETAPRLLSIRYQDIISIIAGIVLIALLGINFSENCTKLLNCHSRKWMWKCYLQMWIFCLSLNVKFLQRTILWVCKPVWHWCLGTKFLGSNISMFTHFPVMFLSDGMLGIAAWLYCLGPALRQIFSTKHIL